MWNKIRLLNVITHKKSYRKSEREKFISCSWVSWHLNKVWKHLKDLELWRDNGILGVQTTQRHDGKTTGDLQLAMNTEFNLTGSVEYIEERKLESKTGL